MGEIPTEKERRRYVRFTGRERRHYVRLGKTLPAKFKIIGESIEKTYTGVTRNISQSGICMEITESVEEIAHRLKPRDIRLDIELKFSNLAEPVKLHSKVEWIRQLLKNSQPWCVVGLSFENISLSNRKKIRSYLFKEFSEGFGKIGGGRN